MSLTLWEAVLIVFLTKSLIVHPPLVAAPAPREREDDRG